MYFSFPKNLIYNLKHAPYLSYVAVFNDRILGVSGTVHEVPNLLALAKETDSAVRHHSL